MYSQQHSAIGQLVVINFSRAVGASWRSFGFQRALAPGELVEVSAEAAALAAQRKLPPVRLPPALEQQVEAMLTDSNVQPKEAARLAKQLTDSLKALSRTPGRGGAGTSRPKRHDRQEPFAGDLGSQPRSRRPSAREVAEARAALEAGQLMSMDERAVNAALGLPPPLRIEERIGAGRGAYC
ncbi:hypothetical protein GPECTOR_15g460 [Gonium pectorale]|uniref:Uncharacterized protein n=1 Tax=Gonium pectorale TaxID=33097 RepID=A0A150GM00_GONPE|nr:hypothetical protein GPECTOR_15g460 [Gonium pectorale]|eukprot:KXZ50775.1 hypothetical protein GPECTOR_15g460 [Gonium pectorale]